MSVFNNIPAFNGLGKASLKLDFETETQLKDFARRYIVDEGDETPDNDPDPEKAAKAIINNLYRRTTGDAYMKPHKGGVDGPGDVYIITDTRSKAKKELDEIKALQKYDVQKFNKETLKDIEEGDPLLFEQLKSDLDTQPATSKKIEYSEPEEVKIFNEIFEAQSPIYKSSNKKIIEPLIKTYLSPDIWESWRTLNRFDGGSVPAGYQMEKDIELIADAIINNEIYKDGYIPFSKVQDAYTSYYYDVKTPKQEIENLQSNIKDASNIKDLKLILKKINSRIDKIKNFQNKFLNGDYFKKEGIILQNTLGVFSSNNEIYNNLDILENGITGYGDFYTVRDMRKRSKKEPGDVRTNKNLDFTKDDSRKMFNFDKSLYELTHGVKSWDLTKKLKSTDWRAVTVKHKTADNKYIVSAYLFFPYTLRRDLDKPTFAGYASEVDVDINLNKVFNYHYYIDSENRIYKERLEGFVNKAYYKELFIQAIKNGYKQLQQRLINTKNSRFANTPANIAEVEKEIKYFKMLYSDPSKYDLLDRAYGGNFNNIRDNVIDITDGKGVELNGLGAASDTLYNNLSILDTRGMLPTYQILPSYDQFFKPAEHKNSFAGFGLDDTKELIADICRKHYKECAGIAAHLKGKTLLQSCFNLWHWLHHNIRYEYDRDGREEVRTPLRVWADRKRGVDCDCLSVFAWCVLKCMGYNPVFELVAFRNKKQLSHIFINCDGVVVDRVWFVFNQRPPQVTKREIYEVKLLQNLGQLF